eukprot:7541106-Pyramimonas_sp.AAC.1
MARISNSPANSLRTPLPGRAPHDRQDLIKPSDGSNIQLSRQFSPYAGTYCVLTVLVVATSYACFMCPQNMPMLLGRCQGGANQLAPPRRMLSLRLGALGI